MSFALCVSEKALCLCDVKACENVVRKFIHLVFVLSPCVNYQQHSKLEVLLDRIQLRH